MSLYPDPPRPLYPYNFRNNRPTIGGGPEWAPQNRALTRFGLHEADLVYHGLSYANAAILYNFFESVGGQAGRFTFIDYNGVGPPGGTDPGVVWTQLFVAKADGITLSWDLPTFGAKADTLTIEDTLWNTPLIYENGVPKTTELLAIGGTPDVSVPYHAYKGAGTDTVDSVTAQAALSTVATAPSPATSGLSLVLHAGDGAHCPATPFFANVWPTAVGPTAANIETIQVTNVATDTLTIVRAQNGTAARSIIVGDQFAVPPAATVILTVTATCRRALRRARFIAAKNPFTLDVPFNYGQQQVTIVEVRR